jgi:putative ABC transport system substrate-binding protein
MKKLFVLSVFLLFAFVLSSCGESDLIKIGILQYDSHVALDDARIGFIEELERAGYVDGENVRINVQNPQGDNNVMQTQAKELVRKSDLIFAIATPAASAVVTVAKQQNSNVPILFTAVTDPVAAKLIASNENPGGNVTGTNDMNPIELQIALVKDLLPNATKLGILYTASEPNSEIQANLAKVEAEKLGLTVIVKTTSSVNDIQTVANQLANQVDIIYIPTDNSIASNMGVINNVILEHKIPAIVGEGNNVRSGGSITYGVNYKYLGMDTAKMAVKILKDNISPKDIPATGQSNYELVINKKQLDKIGITIPEVLLSSADEILE